MPHHQRLDSPPTQSDDNPFLKNRVGNCTSHPLEVNRISKSFISWREETKDLIASLWRGLAAEQCVPLKRPPGLQRATKPRAGQVGHHGRRPHVLARCASDSWGLSPGKLQSCMLMFTGLPLKPFNGLSRFEGLGTSLSMALQEA